MKQVEDVAPALSLLLLLFSHSMPRNNILFDIIIAGVFSMQGVGSLLSVLIVIICLSLGMSDAFTWR